MGRVKFTCEGCFLNDLKGGKAIEYYCQQYLCTRSGKGTGILYGKARVCKKEDVPVGKHRWLTLVSPDDLEGTELLLEPDEHPAAKDYQRRIFAEGIPATMFGVTDLEKEYSRLLEKGVEFTLKPTKAGEVTIAVFNDTCGNLIQIIQK